MYQIDSRTCYPVSEDALHLALDIIDQSYIEAKTKILAEKIVQIYILNETLDRGENTIDYETMDKRFSALILDHIQSKLVERGFVDVSFDNGDFQFKVTKKGEEYFSKSLSDAEDIL